MNSKQLKVGAVLSYVQMAVSVVIGMVYTPLMVRLLGKNEYGLYNTVSSVITMLSVLSLGFNSGYIRYYSKYKKENREDSIAGLNGMFLLILSIIGVVALACGLFLTFNLKYIFADGLTVAEYKTARTLMLLLTVNLSLTFPMSVFQNIISAHERYIFLKSLSIFKTVLVPLIVILLLFCGFKSVAMVVVTLAVNVLVDIAFMVYARKDLKVSFVFRNFEKGLLKSLFVFTSFIAINIVVDQINNNMGKFLLGRYHGTEMVGIYAIGYTIYQYYMMFSTAISGVFTPRLHRIVNLTSDDMELRKKSLSDLFIKVGRIQFAVLSFVCGGFVFFGNYFINLWIGEYCFEAYIVAVLLMLAALTPLIQNAGIEIQRALNKHKFRSIAYAFMALINFALTVFLCRRYGVIGTVLGTVISLILTNGVIMNIYYHKKCYIDIIAFWKSILRMLAGLLPAFVCGVLIVTVFNVDTIVKFICGILAYSAVYFISAWFLAMNRYEKNLVLETLGKMKKVVSRKR